MAFYSRVIFPRLCDFAMRCPMLTDQRRALMADVNGTVLEIGFGTGLNLPHYPPHVRRVVTVDPNPAMHRKARKRIEQSGLEVDQRLLSGERLPFDDKTFDCVVSTWTLCSIDNVGQALAEIYRVLTCGGRFFFVEHGLSPDPRIQKWQRRLNWLQMRLVLRHTKILG